MKTGALLACSVDAGGLLGRADEGQRRSLAVFGRALGAAFQVADDILDRESSAEALGKRTGKDQEAGKGTLVDRLGLEGAKAECRRLTDEALGALDGFGAPAKMLRDAARFTVERQA
jgi:farnesyl diphosphate synthase